MVCTSESVDCHPGFGAIEILIVSVIVVSFICVALSILCCLCRQYAGDDSTDDSCQFNDDDVEIDAVGVARCNKVACSGAGSGAGYFGSSDGGGIGIVNGGGGRGRGNGGGGGLTVPLKLSGRWEESGGEESGNFDSISTGSKGAVGADAHAWNRFCDRPQKGKQNPAGKNATITI